MKVAFTLLILAAAGVVLAVEKAESDGNSRIKPLQQELIATLNEVVEAANVQKQQARGSATEVLEAQRQVLDATLDAAESNEERVKVLQSILDVQRQLEAWAKNGHSNGRITTIEVAKAKAARIKAEIALEKEKANSRK